MTPQAPHSPQDSRKQSPDIIHPRTGRKHQRAGESRRGTERAAKRSSRRAYYIRGRAGDQKRRPVAETPAEDIRAGDLPRISTNAETVTRPQETPEAADLIQTARPTPTLYRTGDQTPPQDGRPAEDIPAGDRDQTRPTYHAPPTNNGKSGRNTDTPRMHENAPQHARGHNPI